MTLERADCAAQALSARLPSSHVQARIGLVEPRARLASSSFPPAARAYDESSPIGTHMGKRGPMTFAKRQRETDKKRLAEEKRARRAERGKQEPTEPEVIICKPIVDEEQV
jgi:hypothetical protein